MGRPTESFEWYNIRGASPQVRLGRVDIASHCQLHLLPMSATHMLVNQLVQHFAASVLVCLLAC